MDTKERIMKTALDLFYAKGYDAVGVQEIVDVAGVTKPTLYYYYNSKYGLLQALLSQGFAGMEQRLLKAAEYRGDVPGTLNKLAGAYLDEAAENHKFYMLVMALMYAARENESYQAVAPIIKRVYQIIVEVFEKAQQQLGNMNGREEQFAIAFIGILNHYFIYKIEQHGHHLTISGREKESLVRQFMYGIFT